MGESVDPDDVADLARLIAVDPQTLSDDELVALVATWGALRRAAPDRLGRAIAVLHEQHGLSWPEIGRRTGIPPMTAHDWARRHLPSEGE